MSKAPTKVTKMSNAPYHEVFLKAQPALSTMVVLTARLLNDQFFMPNTDYLI